MSVSVQPLKAEKFLKDSVSYYESIKDTYIYNAIVRDFKEKTEQIDAGYGKWLKRMLEFVTRGTIKLCNNVNNDAISTNVCGTFVFKFTLKGGN